MIIEIAKEPKVRITVIADDEKILSSTLQIASSFTLDFQGSDFLLKKVHAFLLNYSLKKETGDLPLDLSKQTPFSKKILQELAKVKFGETITYKGLAMLCGNDKAARAAGNALNKNPFALLLACHRVILKTKDEGGFAFGKNLKKTLLFFGKISP